jgi:hypothetical protein
LSDVLNLGAAEEIGVVGEGGAVVTGVGEIGDWGANAVHKGEWDDLHYALACAEALEFINLTSTLASS